MKDAALKLALEALDIVKIHFTQNRHVNEAITAIKQALAAPVQEPEYVYTCNGCDTLYREDDVSCDCTVNGLMEFTRHILAPDTAPPAQPAPVQEPVAWLYKDDWGRTKIAFSKETANEWGTEVQPLYTTPPAAQRQWVGLTFAEICECENDYLHLFARAIEAKLKEKNT